MQKESSKEIWLLQGFFTVSQLLVNLHPVKILALLWCQEFKKCIENWGQNDGSQPYLSKMSAIVQANMRSPSGNCNATKTIQNDGSEIQCNIKSNYNIINSLHC